MKLLHQQSNSNTKVEYIMGHSFQAVPILCKAANTVFSVSLAARIHEGIVLSNRSKRTLLDKMIILLAILEMDSPYYFVADTYYANHKIVNGLLSEGHH